MDDSGGLRLSWDASVKGCGDGMCLGLRIVQADPRILVSRLLLMAALSQMGRGLIHGTLRPGPGARDIGECASSSVQDQAAWLQQAACALEGWVLTVTDDMGRTVVYRIMRKSPLIDGYEAEWPD